MTDYSELKRLAEVQPVKEWSSHDRGMSMFAKERMYGLKGPECVPDHEDWGYARRAASFIAAANPAAVLGLIADNEHLALCARQWEEAAMQWGAERDALKAECEGLRQSLGLARHWCKSALRAAQVSDQEDSPSSTLLDIACLLRHQASDIDAALGKGGQSNG